jgi:hypothetical protein
MPSRYQPIARAQKLGESPVSESAQGCARAASHAWYRRPVRGSRVCRATSRNCRAMSSYAAESRGKGQLYSVGFGRLINSIMLGILTYDANLLIIEPKKI